MSRTLVDPDPRTEGETARAPAVVGLKAALERKYSPDQPRDDHGRWTAGGGGRRVLSPV